MDKDIRVAKIKGKFEIIVALIGGICTIVGGITGAYFGTYFENKKYTEANSNNYINYDNLQKDYENLLTEFEVLEKDYNLLLLQNNTYLPDAETNNSISEADQTEINEIIKRIMSFGK